MKEWCRRQGCHLIVGGTESAGGRQFRNTVFVIDPTGEIVFRQVKSVPIQFFADGLPATERRPWPSPWGRIGLAICYDLSYRRVIDDLVRQEAELLVIPTFDAISWGAGQHQLHARVARVRAAECALPIFRLASSGVSQWIDPAGREQASAPYPGQGAILAATPGLAGPGRLSWDHWAAPGATGVAGIMLLCIFATTPHGRLRRSPTGPSPADPVPCS